MTIEDEDYLRAKANVGRVLAGKWTLERVIGVGGMAAVYSAAHLPYTLWGLATFIPWLALSWRRLHDTNRPGPWWFLWLIPIVGQIILLVFFLQPPKPEGARFDR